MKNTGLPTHRRYEGERRGDPRHEVSMPARLVYDDGVFEGEIENLSAAGASFSTHSIEPELTDDARVVLRASIPTPSGERRIERRGRVMRSEDFFDGEDDVMTYAVAFDEPLSDPLLDDDSER